MSMSLTINSQEINGTGGRRLHGFIHDTRSPSGIREILILGAVTGSDSEDLNDKWKATQELCREFSPRVVIKPDSTTTNNLIDIFAGDGTTVQLTTFVSADTTRAPSATTYPFILHIIASENVPTGSGGNPNDPLIFQGQVGDWKLTTTFNDARVESRALMISFGSTFDEDAYGPFTINSVSNEGGKARFNLAALDEDAIGQTFYVSGSTLYDGPHEVTDLNEGSNYIDTNTTYAGDDTGTGMLGATVEPETNYDAARSSLLTDLLGTEADGSRGSTTGLVLSGESKGLENDVITVILSSDWVEREYNTALRSFQMGVTVADVPDWPDDPNAGFPPKNISVIVTFSVDKEVAGTANPYPMWATIRPTVLARLEAGTAGELFGPIDENVAFDENTGVVMATLSFLAINGTEFSYAKQVNTHRRFEYMSWMDPEGYHAIQHAADPVDEFVTISVTRSGVGEVDIEDFIEDADTLTILSPPPYRYIEITADLGLDQPITRRNIGSIYTQTAVKVFRRFRMRDGEDPRERNPVTGAF